eukprot:189817_1
MSQTGTSSNKTFTNMILVRKANRKEYFYKHWGIAQVNSSDVAMFDQVKFKRNKDVISKDTIKLMIENTKNVVFVAQEQTSDLQQFMTSLHSIHPLPAVVTYPGALHSAIYLAQQVKVKPTSEQNNNVLFCTITDNINTKYNSTIFNIPLDFQVPSIKQMMLINGLGRPVNSKAGIVFKFSVADIIIIDRNQVHPDAVIEQKRTHFLHPRPIAVTDKELIDAASINEFVQRVNGLKKTVHSQSLRAYCVEVDLHKNIRTDSHGVDFYNGTQFWKDDPVNQHSHRFKCKPKPMTDIIFQKPVEEAKNYEFDENFALDVMERIEDKYWNITLMYAPKKIENGEPPNQRRRLNNGASQGIYCTTGWISVTSMEEILNQ